MGLQTEVTAAINPSKPQDTGGKVQPIAAPEGEPLFVLEPSRGWISLKLHDLWEYRELLYFLVWRDVKVRYKQTALGVVWAVLQPFMTMVVFSIFFGYLGNIPSDGIPYPIFTFAALLPWQLFANSLTASGNSLVNNQSLLAKVFFPRLLVPLSAVFVGLVDFSLSLVVLGGMMFYYGIYPTLSVLTLPLFILLALVTALAVGLWLSTLSVHYRDVQLTIPFLTQFWLFATPIAYPSSLLPEQWRVLYGLNPMVGVIEGFRWALLDHANPFNASFVASILVIIGLLVGGVIFFRRMEQTFADVI
jgi:lipopolysaccharide transport system permease protein